jgi:uncharacterized membrane protein YecN with MAPEG domain
MASITLLYAGVLGLISIVLAFGVGSKRGSSGVSIGLGDSEELLVANRRHGNFTEYVPLALILMGLLEMNGVGAMTTHIFGATLVICRICHPLGLRVDVMTHPLRAIGAGGTALLTVVMSIWAIVLFF